jgi:hypothetical protein
MYATAVDASASARTLATTSTLGEPAGGDNGSDGASASAAPSWLYSAIEKLGTLVSLAFA